MWTDRRLKQNALVVIITLSMYTILLWKSTPRFESLTRNTHRLSPLRRHTMFLHKIFSAIYHPWLARNPHPPIQLPCLSSLVHGIYLWAKHPTIYGISLWIGILSMNCTWKALLGGWLLGLSFLFLVFYLDLDLSTTLRYTISLKAKLVCKFIHVWYLAASY